MYTSFHIKANELDNNFLKALKVMIPHPHSLTPQNLTSIIIREILNYLAFFPKY
jgi:hypothetical protein